MIGIDTCFLIDLYWEDSPRHSNAVSLFKAKAADRNVELAVYYNCFNEFLHVITDARRFENPFTMQEGLSVIDEWCSLDRVRILYPDVQAGPQQNQRYADGGGIYLKGCLFYNYGQSV